MLSRLTALLVIAITVSGCVTYDGDPTLTQVGDAGTTLTFDIGACPDGGADPNVPGGVGCLPAGAPGPGTARLITAVQVDSSVTVPLRFTATLSEPRTVTRAGVPGAHSDLRFFADDELTADLMATYPPAGSGQWYGFVSEAVDIAGGMTTTGTASIDVTAPADADGNPVASAIAWRTFLTLRISTDVTGTDPTNDTEDTLDYSCDASSCPGVLFPAATESSLDLRRLTIATTAGSTLAVTGGQSIMPSVDLTLDGALPPSGATVTLAAVSDTPAVTATIAPSEDLVADSTVAVPITVTAGAGATTGTANVTVTMTTGDSTEREVVIPIAVTAAPAPTTPTPTTPTPEPTDSTKPSTTLTTSVAENRVVTIGGTATDTGPVASGIRGVEVQAYRSLGGGRCQVWSGSAVGIDTCATARSTWVKAKLDAAVGSASTTWSRNTLSLAPGQWTIRARTTDVAQLASAYVATTVALRWPSIDTARPVTSLRATTRAGRRIELTGVATDVGTATTGARGVEVQVYRILGGGRCESWTGTDTVEESCDDALDRWHRAALTGSVGADRVAWRRRTTVLDAGRWRARARTTDVAQRASLIQARWVLLRA